MDDLVEVYRQLCDLRNKHTYLLMAVAASAIALSLKRTTGLGLALSIIPLLLAVICWGVSFFYGHRSLILTEVALSSNFNLLISQDVRYQPIEKADDQTLTDEMRCSSKKALLFHNWQFSWIVGGALLFIIWHVIEMAKVIEMVKVTVNSGG